MISLWFVIGLIAGGLVTHLINHVNLSVTNGLRKYWKLAYAAIAGALTAIILAILGAWWSSLDASGKPAWLQAIGAVAGIGIAIAVPYFQRRSAQLDMNAAQLSIARAYVVHLLPSMQDYAHRVWVIHSQLEGIPLGTVALHAALNTTAADFALPEQLRDIGPNSHQLGPMALRVQRVLVIQHWLEASISQFHDAVLGVINNTPEREGEVTNYSFVGRYITQAETLHTAVQDAAESMDEWLWAQTRAQRYPGFTNGDLARKGRDNIALD